VTVSAAGRVPFERPASGVPGVHPLIAARWSPRAFDARPIEPDKLLRIFEAARWAASSYNEQPWRFFLALAGEPHSDRIESFLVEANGWARKAPALLVAATATTFARNGKKNGVAIHDLGLAAATMTLQAMHEGILVHGMAGFDAGRAKAEMHMPPDWEAVAMWAMGYPGTLEGLPEPLRSRELEPRVRRPLSATVFAGEAGQAHPAFARPR
jgi:nitroreductase